MEIVCDECGKRYRIDERKMKGRKARIKCRVCANVMEITKPEIERISGSDLLSMSSARPESEAFRRSTAAQPAFSAREEAEEEISRSFRARTVAEGTSKISWINSMQVRISAILIVITTVILFGFVVYNYFGAKSKMDKELNDFAKVTSTRLSKNLVEPLWAVDEKQIEDSLNSEMMEKRIYAVIVIDRETDVVFLGKKRDSDWNVIKADGNIKGNFIKSRGKIARDKEAIGDVDVYITRKFMQDELNQSVIKISITVIVLNIAIFLAIYFLLRRAIISPIMKLTEVADRMSMGDLNVRVDIKSKNEIGLLAQAVERMQTSLRLALTRLRRKR
jgi:predicted Zn finger-like uncharacterized protein